VIFSVATFTGPAVPFNASGLSTANAIFCSNLSPCAASGNEQIRAARVVASIRLENNRGMFTQIKFFEGGCA